MTISSEGVDRLVSALAAAPAKVRSALRPGISAATTLVAQDIKAEASWSTYIPDAVSEALSVTQKGVAGIVRIAERGAPHAGEARVFEGNALFPTEFSHPVFGHPWEVTQMTRPFAGPVAVEDEPEAAALVDSAIESALLTLFA